MRRLPELAAILRPRGGDHQPHRLAVDLAAAEADFVEQLRRFVPVAPSPTAWKEPAA